MGESNHTPGPFSVAERDGQAAIQGGAGEWLATLPYAPAEGFGLVSLSEVVANARLFAAAPELLEALSALDRMSRGVDWCDQDEQARRWAVARAAIAKAEGRS